MKTILADAVNTLFTDDGIDQQMLEILESFANTKVVLTNANDEQMIEFGIDKSPYEVFTLKHNPDKDDLEYYQKMFETLSLSKGEVIYFEHNLDAVKSTREHGITTLHFDKDKRDLDELKQFLKNNI